MPADCLRKLRLLCEDFPRSHNLVLIGQPPLLQSLALSINEEIRSRVTYSVVLPRLAPASAKAGVWRWRLASSSDTSPQPSPSKTRRDADPTRTCEDCAPPGAKNSPSLQHYSLVKSHKTALAVHWPPNAAAERPLRSKALRRLARSDDVVRQLRKALA